MRSRSGQSGRAGSWRSRPNMSATRRSMTESEPPGWPEPAWVSIRMICTRHARAMAFRRASAIRLLHWVCDGVDANAADGDLWRVHDLVGGPDDGALHVLGDTDDVVEEGRDVVIDADRVGLDRLRDPTVANHIGIGGDRTGEIACAQAVDRVRVPDAADVQAVAHTAQQLVTAHRVGALDDDVGGGRRRLGREVPPAAGAEAEAVARDERGGACGVVGAELVGAPRITQQPLGLVPA